MTIAPIRRSFPVKAPPERAFALFTGRMHDWWPRSHSIATEPRAAIVMEGRAEGRWYEVGEGGAECDWGKVLAWEPPHRLLLAWQITGEWKYDPDFVTEVELGFAPEGSGTLVTFEHRNLERFGAHAAAIADQLRNGWPGILDFYAALVES